MVDMLRSVGLSLPLPLSLSFRSAKEPGATALVTLVALESRWVYTYIYIYIYVCIIFGYEQSNGHFKEKVCIVPGLEVLTRWTLRALTQPVSTVNYAA